MGLLVLAALIWLGLHIGLSGTGLRATVAGRIGERGFQGLFSVLSIAAIVFLIVAYGHAETRLLWVVPGWVVALLDLAMLGAVLLLAASLTPANPTMVGTEATSRGEPRGIFRITRHPMLCSVAIWAGVHMIASGDTASLLFFGTFLLSVLTGIPSIDRKLARRDPARWAPLARATSAMPFAAIAAGRNRLVPAEFGWRGPLLGLVLWVALLVLHPLVIGYPAVPG